MAQCRKIGKFLIILVASPKTCVTLHLFWGEQQAVVAIAATACIFFGGVSLQHHAQTPFDRPTKAVEVSPIKTMKKLLSTHLPTAYSLAGIAHEMLIETRISATNKVSNFRKQVDELWRLADDMLPREKATEVADHVEKVLSALRSRGRIEFPKGLKA